MCVGVWTLEHPEYALILCTNRDEFLSRPTTAATFHSFGVEEDENGSFLSGRDVRAGGTWLGISRSGRFGLLTNITEPYSMYNSSRGSLIPSFLMSDSSNALEDNVGKIVPHDAVFAGFNMLLLAPNTSSNSGDGLSFNASFVTNHGAGGVITSRHLYPHERSCGGISNGIDRQGEEEWPKVQHGVRSLKAVLQTLSPDFTEDDLTDRLFELLSWRSPEPAMERSQLRNTVHVKPIPLNVGTSVGPDLYGTRLATVLLIRKDGQVLFVERDAWKLVDGKLEKGDPRSDRVFRFNLKTEIQ